MAYAPIEDYGIIGDLHTVALVGDGQPLGLGFEAPHLRTDGGHRGGAHQQPSRRPGRGTHLRLPVHVDPRCQLHPSEPHQRGV